MKPFLRIGAFCHAIQQDQSGNWNLSAVHGGVVLGNMPGDRSPIQRQFPTLIAITDVPPGPHRLRVRWADDRGGYLKWEHAADISPNDINEIQTVIMVELFIDPPRGGAFRLVVELDGIALGWLPYRVILAGPMKPGES